MSRQAIALPKLTFGATNKFWIIFAVILWLVFVISHIPAVWGGYLLSRSGDMAFTGVSGSIWSGSASLASVKVKQVNYSLGQVTWKLSPLSLLTLKPCAQITTHMDGQDFEGYACGNGKGSLTVRNATASFPSVLMQPLLPMPIDGKFSLNIESLQLQNNNQVADLHAKLSWGDARVYNGSNWMGLGNFGADLTNDGKMGLNAHIFDVNGPVHLDIIVALLSPTGGSVKGNMSMSEAFHRDANAGAWMAMFAVQQPANEEGKIPYTVDLNF